MKAPCLLPELVRDRSGLLDGLGGEVIEVHSCPASALPGWNS